MPRFALLLTALALLLSRSSAADDWPQWRGPRRDAVSREKKLARSWPREPRMAWRAAGLGSGYASVVVSRGLVFTIGKHGEQVYLFALEEDTGRPRWTRRIGTTSRIPSSTPTVDGDRVYALDPDGDLLCLKTADGEVVWEKSFLEDFAGQMMSGRGYGESPLIDGETLVCTPGGPAAMLAALDKRTGAVRWTSPVPTLGPAGRDGAAFSSIVVSQAAGVRQYVQLVGRGLIGVEADGGRFLWGYNELANTTANIPTPIVRGDLVFAANGYHAGCVLLRLVRDGAGGVAARKVYALGGGRFQNHHGGVVLVGNHVYGGHGSNNGLPTCLDLETGDILWKRRGPGTGSAAVVYADGHLYFRYQNGLIALIEATPDEYRQKGTFPIPVAGGDSWSHPVVANGRLYLREQDHLFVYDVRGGESASPATRPDPSGADADVAELRTLEVPAARLTPESAAAAPQIRRLQRYLYRDAPPQAAPPLLVTLGDQQLETGGTIRAAVRQRLQRLQRPLVLNLGGTRLSDEGLREIAALPNLVGLNLELCREVTDAGLAHLAQAGGLRVLWLTGTAVTDAGLERLAASETLVALDLEICDAVSDAACTPLATMRNLQALVLKKTGFEPQRISDAGLEQLGQLARLELLDLYGNQISDAGLQPLGRMTSLRELDLSLVPITDQALTQLVPLSRLEHLSLLFSEGFAGPIVTDQGLASLAELRSLRSLNLSGARISDDALRQLKAALPKCGITVSRTR